MMDADSVGWLERAVRRFMPAEALEDSTKLFRARVVVALSFALAVFGPVYASILYLVTGSTAESIATIFATLGVVAGPFLMKARVPLVVVGNWLTFCGFALFAFVASRELGLAVLIWQVVFAMFAALIAGKRSALAWLVIMSATTAYFYVDLIRGAPAQGIWLNTTQLIWEMSLVIGMFAAVMVLTLTYETIKEWAVAEVRRSEAQTRAIFDAAPDGILTLSEEGRVGRVNAAALQLLGYDSTELRRVNFWSLLPRVKTSLPACGFEEAAQEETPEQGLFQEAREHGEGLSAWLGRGHETVARRREGASFPAELSLTRIGEEERFVAILRDITERREFQESLKIARDQAVEANHAKSRFLANISHELRTPLNAIIGYSELILDDLEEFERVDAEGLRPDITKIGKAGRHLLGLINQVLDLAKVEAGKMDVYVETIDVRELLEEVTDTIMPVVTKNKNTLQVSLNQAPDVVRADRMKLRQVLINLLSNASKFTEEGTIEVRVVEHPEQRCVFEVIDSGIGIPPEKLQALFEAFRQADDSTTREYGGTGLGLTISQHFAQLMRGDIEVESQVGEGSTFRVILPLDFDDEEQVVVSAEAPHEERATEEAREEGPELDEELVEESPAAEGGPRVLVIDDDPTVHQLMKRYLPRQGFCVHTCLGGEDTLEVVRSVRPDVITLDVLMPEVDGWDVLRRLKEDRELSAIPVVMVTIVSEKNVGLSLGAADYLTKPVDRHELSRVLHAHVASPGVGPVLVVEDDDATRELLIRTIRGGGWKTLGACDGLEALDFIDGGAAPSAILLDLMMPRLDGFGLLERLRRRPEAADIPVIVFSAADLDARDRERLSRDVTRILKKGGFVKKQLLHDLRQAIESGRRASEDRV
ncbi:hybrid sensor histidine kinase/response regulator [Lujinxingia litoralis]|uniref:histidine kinase n=1 Tax=Lujinxingia litoralis TaxID=2211119 RepID=A0A328C270_9DELT|nr:response regulator [Lujinxingia litoralis]RAL20523.1 hybrid sensor histidine kinase/response regulator [Lujinxingia litoralis]